MKKPIIEPSAISKHIKNMGFSDSDEYLHWCMNNGFESRLQKSTIQMREERRRQKENATAKILKESSARLRGAANYVPHKHAEKGLIEFFEFLKKKSKLISNKKSDFGRKPYTVGLQTLWYFNNYWIKDYKDWKPTSKNVRKQFSSIVRYLLTDYEIPVFMDEAWFVEPRNNDNKSLYYDRTNNLDWFLRLCEGKNIRKLDKLPIELTKKQAHNFIQAPNDYSIDEAFRYGQILGWGGDKRLVECVNVKTPVVQTGGYGAEPNNFWDPLIRMFINNPMLDPHVYGELVDYVRAEKNENRGFSFKHRTADSLLRRSEEWHNQIRKTQGKNFVEWEADKEIKPLYQEEGIPGKKSHRIWSIEQLMNSKELAAEGKAMRHCVRSYTSSCKAGRCTIWSLKNMEARCVTLEVNKAFTIVQAKGLANRSMNAVEKRIVETWAAKNHLTMGRRL